MSATRPRSAAEQAHESIRAGIVDGTYPPGMLLSENDLAAALGVSRTPVRSALARLREDGWVTIYPQRGALVNSLTPRELKDLADARLTLETSGVSRTDASQRQTIADQLERLVDQQRRALQRRRVGDFIELTVKFHSSFVEAGDNTYLIGLNRRLSDRQRQLLHAQQEHLLARAEHLIDEHQQLVGALRHGDVAAFADTLRRHLTETHGPVLGPA
ncbi:GntR family transcriptional regulator [Actinocatenispora thailandica]|uniref:GntR family transcriptional regulator n=1 Tax=Actinocatenispora thailandica TaxID=227318 RepID=A0A7R7I0G6_9ACTN|nr:GntR family transcriptional regulator [Actinocatenispora thailandica]BCJ38571.1 GntR family transcriptional regulator [Actinocatenispora thailandica]